MAAYCGKSCDDCTYKEELSCTGCQSGPGRPISGDCKLAYCCRDKGHETCETCSLKRNCGIWLDKGSIPKQRMERRAEEQEQQAVLKRRAPFLAKWLSVLFWLIVPKFVGSVLTTDTIVAVMPKMQQIGELLQQGSFLIQAVIFLHISKEHKSYRTAGILGLIDVLLYAAVSVWGLTDLSFGILLAVVELVVVLVSAKYEYLAHAELVLPIDGGLSEQWDILWKWQLYSTISLMVSLFLTGMVPLLGLLLALASMIGMAVSAVKNFICLKRTARLFCKIAESMME